jgi:branched-chain amino acid transport system substrate-binding protein
MTHTPGRLRQKASVIAIVVAGLALSACSDPGSSGSDDAGTIKIGLVTSLTGDSAADLAPAEAAAQARIDEQNAAGGIDGKKLELVTADDQSTPAGAMTAVRTLVDRDKVFGVISMSSMLVGAASYLQENGVPVTGAGFDGPEWGQEPNTNMFSIDAINPEYPPTTIWGEFFKSIGVTKVAGIAYADIPSSSDSLKQIQKSVVAAGLEDVYTNVTIPYGTTDFTAIVLQMKKAGADGYLCSCTAATELALATAVKQAGLDAKGVLSTGYAQSTLDDDAQREAAEGQYAYSYYVPYELKTEGTEAMLAALAKYDKTFEAGTIPSYYISTSYLSTDLMVTGLEKAGADPTPEKFIKNLRTVDAYDANGTLPAPVSFLPEEFGKSVAEPCNYFVQLVGDEFVPQPKVCGEVITG